MTSEGKPRCLVVQHVEPEGPYALADALGAAGIEVDVRRVFLGDQLPETMAGLDALIVMGGPMSAVDDDGFPTRQDECRLLVDALAAGVPTLGICLGAQLLALAAGGRVLPGGAGPEIGWAPVRMSGDAAYDLLFASAAAELTVLHWHGDTYTLPPGATLLASSASYAQQAFRVGDRAWGLQFHVEVDESAVKAFLAEFEDEVVRAGHDPQRIADDTSAALDQLGPFREAAFAAFTDLVLSQAAGRGATRVVSQATAG